MPLGLITQEIYLSVASITRNTCTILWLKVKVTHRRRLLFLPLGAWSLGIRPCWVQGEAPGMRLEDHLPHRGGQGTRNKVCMKLKASAQIGYHVLHFKAL